MAAPWSRFIHGFEPRPSGQPASIRPAIFLQAQLQPEVPPVGGGSRGDRPAAKGHSLAVHVSSYRWASEASTAAAFEKAFAA